MRALNVRLPVGITFSSLPVRTGDGEQYCIQIAWQEQCTGFVPSENFLYKIEVQARDSFNGYVDNFTIGTASGTTTYNFEPVPEPGSMLALGSGLMGLAGLVLRRKRA